MNDTQTLQPIKPCWHMKTLLSQLVDGTLHGLTQKYAVWHVAHCPRCLAALEALKQLSLRLHGLGAAPAPADAQTAAAPALSEDRWSAMEAAWEKAERSGP